MSNPVPSSVPTLEQKPKTTNPPGEWHKSPSTRRILGIQPALFVGMCLLAVVSLVTVVLIFTGDFESQAERVIWTMLVFLGFTGLLAWDLSLSRRDPTPLMLGVAGNTYLLAVSMIVIWMRSSDDYGLESGWIFGIIILMFAVVRAAVAGAWGLITLGRKSATPFGRGTGLTAASLVGLAGFLLTFHYVLDAFNSEPSELYWRTTVAVIVITALASSITVLLFWNRRNLEWEEAEAAGAVQSPAKPAPAPVPQAPQVVSPVMPAPAAQELHSEAGPTIMGVVTSQGETLLPWPTYPDGSPYPQGPDGQPVFPPTK